MHSLLAQIGTARMRSVRTSSLAEMLLCQYLIHNTLKVQIACEYRTGFSNDANCQPVAVLLVLVTSDVASK